MDIDEIRREKQKLESEILLLTDKFESKTGVRVVKADFIQKSEALDIGCYWKTYSYNTVDVTLERI